MHDLDRHVLKQITICPHEQITICPHDWQGPTHLRTEALCALDEVVRQVQLPQFREPLEPLNGGQPAMHGGGEMQSVGGGRQ